jgi:hypothetical protein
MNRTGKVARLPRSLRDELNRRLERNIPGRALLAWLNSLPEVQEIMESLFNGKPVSPQNLSEWRQGGFAEWQTRNDLLDRLRTVAGTSEEIEATCGMMAEHAARLLSAQIALMLTEPEETRNPAKLKQLSGLIRDIAILRRGDHSAARLKMEQHAFEFARKDREARDAQKVQPSPAPVVVSSRPTGESDLIKPNQTIDTEASALQNDPSHPPSPVDVPRLPDHAAPKRRHPAGSLQKTEPLTRASGNTSVAVNQNLPAADAA